MLNGGISLKVKHLPVVEPFLQSAKSLFQKSGQLIASDLT